jgi:acetolactate synthase-1/2/3 large subunit
MKVTDYIISFFVSHNIKYIFGYQGGMITHLVDSISKNKDIQFVQCYHEQSAAIAAEGYARASGKFGVAVSTSGPGATNMITGIANAYYDSIPVIYITGQVNTYEYKYQKPIRQMGFQETDIVSIVKPITKYAVMIDDATHIKYELEKAVDIATTGRKGPVLLDIPMNIQRADISPINLSSYSDFYKKPLLDLMVVQEAISLLHNADRPLVLCGGGVLTCKKKLDAFLSKTKLPYVVSLMGKGCVGETKECFIGMIGSYGNRCANLVFFHADVVLVLGSRLDLRQTGNKNFGNWDKVRFIHVDVDINELKDDSVKNKVLIHASVEGFLDALARMKSVFSAKTDWIKFAMFLKEKYSQKNDVARFLQNTAPYKTLEQIGLKADGDAIFTVDIGQNQMWAAQTLQLRPDQMFFTSGGLAPMGYSLPSAVGAAFAFPEKKVICIIGDGGFHIALQSLLLISQYKLNIMVFVLNNHALGMITQFQTLYFESNMAGTTSEGGYKVPDIKYIAKACGLEYECVDDVINKKIPDFSGGKIVEIELKELTTVVPKLEYNQPLYNMIPYLNTDEIEQMKSIALTGATSMIGIALIKQCVQNNITVLALVRSGSLRRDRVPDSDLVTILECDLDSLARSNIPSNVTLPVDIFYHIGWEATDKAERNSCDRQLKNIVYTLDAVSFAKKLGCRRFIGTGSQAEYGNASMPLNGNIPVDPETAYGVVKYTAGKLSKIECDELNLEYIWVRILSVYGVNDNDNTLIKNFINKCKNNQSMSLSACTHVWDYLYEDDAGRALLSIGKKGISGKIYCLGSGAGRPLKEYLEAIKNIINPNYQPDYGKIPYTKKSIRYLCADISELTTDTGWKPEISFEEGVRKMIGAPPKKM